MYGLLCRSATNINFRRAKALTKRRGAFIQVPGLKARANERNRLYPKNLSVIEYIPKAGLKARAIEKNRLYPKNLFVNE
jgi:hypothetical protein